MKNFLLNLLMFTMFLATLITFWAALTMVFETSLWNLVLGCFSVFFFFRALELADKSYGYGKYNKDNKDKEDDEKNYNHPEDGGDLMEN